jgi:hypothetical protein
MGCNCATQQQISKLYSLYGEKNSLNKTKKQSIGEFFKKTAIHLIIFLLFPIILSYVLYVYFFTKDKHISIKKFFNFKKSGFNEEMIENIIKNSNNIESE